MGSKGKIRYVFTSSNTDKGFYSFIPGLLEGLKRVYILQGATGTGKSSLIRYWGDVLAEQGYEIEFWMSALEPMNPEGVYIQQIETAIINGSAPNNINPKYPVVIEQTINLSEFLDEAVLSEKGLEIIKLIDQMEKYRSDAADIIRQANQAMEEMLIITGSTINENKLNGLIDELEKEILREKPGEKHYFASSLTPEGVIDYIDEISSPCKKRFILKGKHSKSKSRVINELAWRARNKGYFVEYYHYGLDPDNINMIIISNLHLAIIDVGEMKIIARPWDVPIDLDQCIDYHDLDYPDLHDVESKRKYESYLLAAQGQLENASDTLRKLKRIYAEAMDFEKLEEIKAKILKQITI